jgi:hypothetical protein
MKKILRRQNAGTQKDDATDDGDVDRTTAD